MAGDVGNQRAQQQLAVTLGALFAGPQDGQVAYQRLDLLARALDPPA
jgi:hypothetical protein